MKERKDGRQIEALSLTPRIKGRMEGMSPNVIASPFVQSLHSGMRIEEHTRPPCRDAQLHIISNRSKTANENATEYIAD